MIGVTLKYIQKEKNLSATEIAEGIISTTQLSRIKAQNQSPKIEQFIKLLYRLNVAFEEFCYVSNNDYLKARIETKDDLVSITRKKNPHELEHIIKKLDNHYQQYQDSYFLHMRCYAQAVLILSKSNYDYRETLEVLEPISDYLLSVKTWCEYEFRLFVNCIYLYPLEVAVSIGNDALGKMKNSYLDVQYDNEIRYAMLLNLAIYALEDEKFYHQAYLYITEALALPASENLLYLSLMGQIVHQVICYKMGDHNYDQTYLFHLINSSKLMKLDDLHQQYSNFVKKHGIILDAT